MAENQSLREKVREKYSAIAHKTDENSSCCAPETSCCAPGEQSAAYSRMNEDYSATTGYMAEADLGLGCGLPTESAGIQQGDTVLDLGSGAGNDAFVARSQTGPTGRIIGIDMTPAMVAKARNNAEKLGYQNVEFQAGDIEDLPLAPNSVDRVISNCVLNLVPDKGRAYAEIFRVLRPGGGFCISDIVTRGDLPEIIRNSIELYTGCIAGAMRQAKYLQTIISTGFESVEITKSRYIPLPEGTLQSLLTEDEIATFQSEKKGVYSITVIGRKPVSSGS